MLNNMGIFGDYIIKKCMEKEVKVDITQDTCGFESFVIVRLTRNNIDLCIKYDLRDIICADDLSEFIYYFDEKFKEFMNMGE